MMLNPIILALVFAFLARGAGGEDVNTNNGTKSSQNGTSTTKKGNVSKGQVVNECEDCAKMCQECSSTSPNSRNKRIQIKTDGTEGALTEVQPTNTTMTENFTKRSSPPVQTDASGTMRSKNDIIQLSINHSYHHHNPRNLAPWIALTIVSVLLVGLVVYHWHTVIRRPRWNQDPNNDAVVANPDVAFPSFAMRPTSTNISQVQLNEESKPLKSLLEHPSTLKRICVVLDTRMPGCGDYEAVAQHYGFDHYERKSDLEKADDGPSRALIEGLAARHPNLTVEEFVVVVEEKTKRGDVSWLLRKYDSM